MNSMDSVVQVVLIAESRRLQASLNTFGIQTQTPEEIEPVQIWSQWDMVKVLERLGKNDRLGLSGRPVRPIGALGSSKVYRVSGQTVLCYPLIFSASEFYLSHDLALLIDDIRSDIKFICKRWRLAGRPTVCIVVTEDNMKNPQFPEMLQFLTEMKSHRIDNIKISLGRLQNLMSCACIEHLDFSFSIDLNELNIQPFAQVQHHHVGYTSLTEGPKLVAKEEEKRDFLKDFKDKPTNEIANTILKLDHLYGKIQLLGVLLQRHGEDFMVGDTRVKTHLEQLNRKAGSLRYWSAVRYSASLLKQMIDSISPYVTQILVNGKQVTVGTVGLKRCATFNKPMTPAEIHAAIYAEVQPFNIIGAVLQQELILYCGKLIATNPELFAGILKVRIGWILHALELYRGMTVENPEPLETCSPSRLRKLLLEVLSKSRAIHFTMTKPISSDDVDPDKFIPANPIYHIGDVDLTIYQVRQLSGCLIRVPDNFYEDLWHILKKAPEGIYVGDYHLPQEPTISKMACNELSFAHTVENMLNSYSVPVDKQIAIECLSVLGKILKRHPEIRLIDAIRVENLIDEASSMYFQDHKTSSGSPRDVFYRLSISHTSAYLGKAIIMSLLHGPNLTQFAVSAAASEFHCRVQ